MTGVSVVEVGGTTEVGGHMGNIEVGRCRGQLQVQRGDRGWTDVYPGHHPLSFMNRLCAELDCGPALNRTTMYTDGKREVAYLHHERCDHTPLSHTHPSHTPLRDCLDSHTRLSAWGLELVCSDSVRLLGGHGICSGSLQVRDQTQSWTRVCEGALDHRGAEVLCRELGCGTPLLQGALSPPGQTFHCEGHEASLMDCPQTQTRPRTCSALQLTCLEPLRLVGGASGCEGTVELKYRGAWRPVMTHDAWDLRQAASVCSDVRCGPPLHTEKILELKRRDLRVARPEVSDQWEVTSGCVSRSSVRDCVLHGGLSQRSEHGLRVQCLERLDVPNVSVSEGVWSQQEGGGVWVLVDADFQLKCSVEPQYQGGTFTLLSPTADLIEPAVNHSAHFLFTKAGPAHRGRYTCVYKVQVLNHSLSSNSSLLIHHGVAGSSLLLRALVLLLLHLLYVVPFALCCRQVTRGRQRGQGSRGHRAGPEEEPADVVFQETRVL